MENIIKNVDMLSKTVVNNERLALNDQQLQDAKSVLIKKNLLFPQSVRTIDDPLLYGQDYGLFSFTPSRNAHPDSNGLYGVFKLRGNFRTIEECDERAEYLIQNHDSYNEIFTVRVGQTIPLTKRSELAEKVNFVEMAETTNKVVSEDVKQKRKDEEKEMKVIKQREQKLLQENEEILKGEFKEDPLDAYIMLRTKKAQLMFMLSENLKRIKNEILPSIQKTRREIEENDVSYPDFKGIYFERFKNARESVGIKNNELESHNSFLKFLEDSNDLDVDLLVEELEKLDV